MCDSDNINRLCRICSGEREGISIYGDEGIRNKLEAKIKSYLHIEISRDDELPKVVCSTCTEKIDNHHKFALMALKVQDELYSLIQPHEMPSSSGHSVGDTNDKVDEHNDDVDDDDDDDDDVDDDIGDDAEDEEDNEVEEDNEQEEESDSEGKTETDYTGSLLHSILTYGHQRMSRSQILTGTEVTGEEMEVRIDPMLFLSGQDGNGEEDEMENNSNSIVPDSYKSSGETNGGGDGKESKPYQCTICPRGFNTEISLQNHLWSHLSRKVLSNTDLNSRLRRKGSVYSSNGVLHTVGTMPHSHPYHCPVCGRQISTKGNLKVHLETHRPKGRYDCDICGRIFKTQSNLYRHKEYHGGIQFTCEVCARVYPTKSTLRAHSITHSDLRPHQCPLCDKTFKRNQDLKFHINQHTGARPYKCPFCPKAFASSGNCFSHRKRMHPSELEKYKEMNNGYGQ